MIGPPWQHPGSGWRPVLTLMAVAALLISCSTPDRGAAQNAGEVRPYYVAADEVAWNYAPDDRDDITGAPFDDAAKVFVAHGPGRIGATYEKCLYRAYTDATFRTLQERPATDAYLGNLGPTIRAEVGDTITVAFHNNCPFPTSMHPHGVFYDKASEGAPYSDGTTGADIADDSVAPGGAHTYTWEVPERAGPGPADGSSVMWMYHSHTDEVGDVYAGLTGFLVVTAKGKARADGSPIDVDREVFSLFEVDDENASPLIDESIAKFAGAPAPDKADAGFIESNTMHSINGYVYGNGPVVAMNRGERVRWYLMGMGSEIDLHTPHWHGNTVLINGMRTDIANLLPASMVVADMIPDNPGIWLYHCHVGAHISAGMQARYRVESEGLSSESLTRPSA
jgi:FtsP/CotA-like multicopper oxidase with cupredoxin domain